MNDDQQLWTYNSRGDQTSFTVQLWDGSEWQNATRQDFTFDSQGNLTEELDRTWGDTDWVYSQRYMYTYQPLTAVKESRTLPERFSLSDNFPNPFNPSTQVRYTVGKRTYVTLKIFDVIGREVATLVNGWVEPGEHHAIWKAGGVSSGVYFYKIVAGNFVQTKKMTLVR
jgi:hypothetical protein